MTPPASEDIGAKQWRNILFAVTSYWVCSIGLVFLNKHLLSGADGKVDAPLFITWCQCFTTVALCCLLSWASRISGGKLKFPKLDVDLERCKKVLPLSIVFVAMISFNNVSLKYVGVSFYYIGRSLSTVFNVILTYYILGEKSSVCVTSSCAIIVLGFALGVDQEDVNGSMSTFGVICGVLASLAVALNAIFTKRVLPKVDNCIWKMTWYNNLNALFLFIPLMVIDGEISHILNNPPNVNFWKMLFISGLFGFAMNYVTGWQIQATSPLSHNISATAKSAAQTVMAVMVFSEAKTLLWWTSNLIILLGSALYTWIRNSEMNKSPPKKLKKKVK